MTTATQPASAAIVGISDWPGSPMSTLHYMTVSVEMGAIVVRAERRNSLQPEHQQPPRAIEVEVQP